MTNCSGGYTYHEQAQDSVFSEYSLTAPQIPSSSLMQLLADSTPIKKDEGMGYMGIFRRNIVTANGATEKDDGTEYIDIRKKTGDHKRCNYLCVSTLKDKWIGRYYSHLSSGNLLLRWICGLHLINVFIGVLNCNTRNCVRAFSETAPLELINMVTMQSWVPVHWKAIKRSWSKQLCIQTSLDFEQP